MHPLASRLISNEATFVCSDLWGMAPAGKTLMFSDFDGLASCNVCHGIATKTSPFPKKLPNAKTAWGSSVGWPNEVK